MIPTIIFWALAAVMFGLVVYAFIDHHNRVYGNIFATLIAVIVAFWLSVNAINGNVGTVKTVINETVTNGSVAYSYTDLSIPIQDASLGYVFAFIGVIEIIIMVVFVIAAIREQAIEEVDEDAI